MSNLVYNEDDHYDFDRLDNNLIAAVEEGASWGFFDYRGAGGVEQVEGFAEGFQNLPIDWTISSNRKRGFFSLLARITACQ